MHQATFGFVKRGFATLTPERRREIASSGGKAAQAKGFAHRFTPEEAVSAGRAGGRSVVASKGVNYMRLIGSAGGSKTARRKLSKGGEQ